MGDAGMGEASGAVTRAHGDTGTGHALGPCLLVGIKPFPDPAAPRDNLGSRAGRALSMQPPEIPGFPRLHLPELSQGSTGSARCPWRTWENSMEIQRGGDPGDLLPHPAQGPPEKPLPMGRGIHGATWEGRWGIAEIVAIGSVASSFPILKPPFQSWNLHSNQSWSLPSQSWSLPSQSQPPPS